MRRLQYVECFIVIRLKRSLQLQIAAIIWVETLTELTCLIAFCSSVAECGKSFRTVVEERLVKLTSIFIEFLAFVPGVLIQ